MSQPPLDIPQQAPALEPSLEETHVLLELTPNGDESSSYKLALPKTWAYSKEFGPVPSGLFETQGLGFFAGSAKPGTPLVAVTVTRIPFEIPIDTWARLSFASEGWKVLAANWFPGPHGLFYDLTGSRELDTGAEIRRTSLRADGSRIFCVNSFCARERWDEAKELFWVAHASFELVRGTGSTRMEPWKAATAEAPTFELGFPLSWRQEPVASARSEQSTVELRLLDARQETLLAALQIKARRTAPDAPPDSLEQLGARALQQLGLSGFIPSALMQPLSRTEDPRAIAVEGWHGGFSVDGQLLDRDVNARLGFVARSGVRFTFSLLSPRLADDTLVALRAQRCFEIARQTLHLL